ncbi:MAG: peptidylprolyl isomerase [Acidobacteriota bacterium]
MRNRLIVAALIAVLAACSGAKEYAKQDEAAKPAAPPPAEYKVRFETTKGPFVIEVKREWAPRGADHFHELVSSRFYDGTRFHRVIRGFVVQFGINGNPKKNAMWSTTRIPDESPKPAKPLKNKKGTITFAVLGANSRATQVFINLRDNLDLDKSGFLPFGRVIEGMDIVEKLYYSYGELMPRGSGPDPEKSEMMGETNFARTFPRLDKIEKAVIE